MDELVFRMPDVGEGIVEAEIIEWFLDVGDHVTTDQPIVEVMTDKATIELPSPVAGVVMSLGGNVGERIAVGAPLIVVAAEHAARTPTPDADVDAAAVTPATGARHSELTPPAPKRPERPLADAERMAASSDRPIASPALRRRALDEGIDLHAVVGTGPAGRVTHDDLDRALAHDRAPGARRGSPRPETDDVTEIEIVGLRRRIAERMSLATSRIPHITYVDEVDMTELERLRHSLNARPGGDRKLTPLCFVIRALVQAIADFPTMNARFDDDAGVLRQHAAVHVGVATQTKRGLVVPVIRHAEVLDVWELAEAVRRVAAAAGENALSRDELTGSTITVSSLGSLGGVMTTPVINHPEVAVVGVNKMDVRPVWDGAAFAPRTMMNLSSSFDHRIVDGYDAALFVQRMRQLLAQPALGFIEDQRRG